MKKKTGEYSNGQKNEEKKERSIEVIKHSFVCMLIKQQYNHFIFHVVILNILRVTHTTRDTHVHTFFFFDLFDCPVCCWALVFFLSCLYILHGVRSSMCTQIDIRHACSHAQVPTISQFVARERKWLKKLSHPKPLLKADSKRKYNLKSACRHELQTQ